MHTFIYKITILAFFTCVLCSSTGLAQTDITAVALDQSVIDMNGIAFDQWINTQIKHYETYNHNPDTLTLYLVERLKIKRYVSGKTLKSVLKLHNRFDMIGIAKGLEKGLAYDSIVPRYEHKLRYLQEITPLVTENAFLHLEMQGVLAGVYKDLGDSTNYLPIYKAIVSTAGPFGNEVLLRRIGALNTLGLYYFQKWEFEKAEPYFLKILSFDWVTIFDDTRPIFRREYIYAAKRLLDCRKNNIDALKNTFFITSTRHELDPLKERYIKEAEEK